VGAVGGGWGGGGWGGRVGQHSGWALNPSHRTESGWQLMPLLGTSIRVNES